MNLTGEVLGPIAEIFKSTFDGLDNLFTSDEDRLKAQAILTTAKNELIEKINSGQIELNKIEASSESIFKSGWRPFTGWTLASGLFLQVIVNPFISYIGYDIVSLDTSAMYSMITGMLGMAGVRSYDKLKGTNIAGMKK